MTISNRKNNNSWWFAATVAAMLSSPVVVLAQPYDADENEEQAEVVVEFSQAELEQILAPIALYPDTLLTHILIAATYPIEVIDADRFLTKHKNYSEREITRKAENKDWDPSVKALLPFPRILENLSEDLGWMRKLGDAFLQDESRVLASIQSLRKKADEAGSLAQMDNVEIIREKRTIIIEPAQPEVVYVPYYDTRVVYGHWHWSHYPPIYWHRPVHFSYYHGPFYWHAGVHIAVDFFFSAFHWHNHHVVRHHHKKRYYHSNRRIATSHHAKRWYHNPSHRRGVAYRTNKIKHRYDSTRPSVSHSKAVRAKHKQHIAQVKHKEDVKLHQRAKFESKKHRQVTERLKVNKAVKVTDKQKYTRNKVSKGDKFKYSPGRIEDKKRFVNNKQSNKNYARDTWKKEPRVKAQPKPSYKKAPVKQYTKSEKSYKSSGKQNTYRAKGGHSNKQYSRVAKSSSSKSQSSVKSSRQKHK